MRWPPLLFWCPDNLVSCWSQPFARIGCEITGNTKGELARLFKLPLESADLEQVFAKNKGADLHLQGQQSLVGVALDTTGIWADTPMWWISMHRTKTPLANLVIRTLLASGAKRVWGSPACKELYVTVSDEMQPLFQDGLSDCSVDVLESDLSSFRDKQQVLVANYSIARNNAVINVHCGPAIDPKDKTPRQYVALDYTPFTFRFRSRRKLKRIIEETLEESGYNRIEIDFQDSV